MASFLAIPTFLVVAHPDDECMFFTPTLLSFENVTVICLTDGGYRSKEDGILRRGEMKRSCEEVFGVERCHFASIPGVNDTPIAGEWSGKEDKVVKLIEVRGEEKQGAKAEASNYSEQSCQHYTAHLPADTTLHSTCFVTPAYLRAR